MRIAYDVQPLVSEQKTGIEYVMTSVLDLLLQRGQDEPTLLYFAKGKTSGELRTVREYQARGAKAEPCNWFASKVYNALWLLIPVPYRWFFRYEADITHFQNNYAPPGVKGKVVATVHDIVPLLHPEWMSKKARLRAKLCMRAGCRRADHIVTDSAHSKGEIVRHCGVAPEKITVIPCGVDSNRFSPEGAPGEAERVRAAYGIKGDYLLYIGSLVPHKNLGRLLRAYAKARAGCEGLPGLVIGGGGWRREALQQQAADLGLGDAISFIGYVADEDIPPLLRGAAAFVFPSLYEGFGMPPLEAMACGTPVVASNATSLPEVVGGAGLLVDPLDENAWAQAIQRVCTDEALRGELRQKGIARAGTFTWEQAFEQLLAVYRAVREST